MPTGVGWSAGDHPPSGSDRVEGELPAGLPTEVLLLVTRREWASGESFGVSEEFVFEDGRRAVIDAGRGFTVGNPLEVDAAGRVKAAPPLALSDDRVRETVMNVVGADEGEPEDSQPWERLAWLARGRGLSVTADDLRKLPLRIEIIR